MPNGFKNVKDIAMYFHSSFRNVGLYTSISLATMAAARSYLDSNIAYYMILISMSIVILIVSFLLNYFLFMRIYELSFNFSNLNIWLITSMIMFVLQIILSIFGGVLIYSHFSS